MTSQLGPICIILHLKIYIWFGAIALFIFGGMVFNMDCVTPEVKINVNSSGYLMNVDVWVSESYFQVLNFCFLHFCGGEGTYLPLVGFRPVSDHFTVLDSVWSLGTQLYSVGFSQSRIGVKSMFASVVFSVLGPLRPGISELLEAIHKKSQPGAFERHSRV